ncbi:hypothetical protein PRVXH_002286 [Proteinivorax hydrogeniformans]|uniref:Uncharacterized protein n=1 Tax=Proteinivorax hydrogeniformans TaxID=1826727 RepID=A0AAU8HSI2_9FIRM
MDDIRIESMEKVRLSEIVKKVYPPKYRSIKITNQLLDGSYHTQVIGDPQKSISFKVIANQGQVEIIDEIESKAEYIRLIEYDKSFTGEIDGPIMWSRITVGFKDKNRRLFKGDVKLNILDEEKYK